MNEAFTRLQFDSAAQRTEFEAERQRQQQALVSLEYYHSLLLADGLQKGNKVLQSKHNELSKKWRTLSAAHNNASTVDGDNTPSVFQLEHVLLEERKKNVSLSKQL